MKTLITEVEGLADSGAIEDAVRLSGEELARYDNIWRHAHNEHTDNVSSAVHDLTDMAVCHCDMLMRAGLYQDAFATAVTSIMPISIEGMETSMGQQLVALLSLSCLALDAMSDKLNPDDEHTATHFPVIIRYCASMLYYRYSQTVSEPGIWHHRITPLLRNLIRMQAVESPDVTITAPDGKTTAVPASDTSAILGDLLGRAAALSLL